MPDDFDVADIITEAAEPEPIEEAHTEAPLASQDEDSVEVEAEPAVDAAETPSAPDPWGDLRNDPRFAGYIEEAGGDPAKILERLHGFRTARARGEEADEVEEVEAEPMLGSGTGIWPPESIDDLHARATSSAQGAAEAGWWVLQNTGRVDPQVAQEVYNNWFYSNPAQAKAAWDQVREAQFEARMEERWGERFAAMEPLQKQHVNTVTETAKDLAQKEIGDEEWLAVQPQLAALFQDEQAKAYYLRHGNAPSQLAEGLVEAYTAIKAAEWRQQRRAQAAAPEAAPAAEPPRTATTRRGSAPAVNQSANQKLADAIIGV